MIVTIDSAGRIVIPKAIREREGLVAGTEMEISVENGRIELEMPYAKLEWRDGHPVFVPPPGAPTITIEEINRLIEEDRNERGLIDEEELARWHAPAVEAAPAAGVRRGPERRKAGGARKAKGRGAA